MLRSTFSRANAALKALKTVRHAPQHVDIDISALSMTSFSPMNPGVVVSRLPLVSKASQGTLEPKNSDTTTLPMSSFSPMNPGVTVLRNFPGAESGSEGAKTGGTTWADVYAETQRHMLGSRARVLEDIPSVLKRFDVPKANVLMRFPTRDVGSSGSQNRASAPSTSQRSMMLQAGSEIKTEVVFKTQAPWFANLPAFLCPREGTTVYASLAPEYQSQIHMATRGRKPGFWQCVVYGNADPDDTGVTVKVVKEKTKIEVDVEDTKTATHITQRDTEDAHHGAGYVGLAK